MLLVPGAARTPPGGIPYWHACSCLRKNLLVGLVSRLYSASLNRSFPMLRFPSCSGFRNHNETCAGCIVSCTTASNCSCNWSRSTSWRSVELNAAAQGLEECGNGQCRDDDHQRLRALPAEKPGQAFQPTHAVLAPPLR